MGRLERTRFAKVDIDKGERRVRLDGHWYHAQDVGCPDFLDAEQSRFRQHSTDSWWIRMEKARDSTKHGKDMPDVVPIDLEWMMGIASPKRSPDRGTDQEGG